MEHRGVLIIYASKHGQTEKIVRRLEARLHERAVRVRVLPETALDGGSEPTGGEVVVVGSPVHFGRHRRAIVDYVRRHARDLADRPGLFFSVSGAAIGESPEARAEAEGHLANFSRRTGWKPSEAVSLGGAVRYTRYNPLVRWVMKRISARQGLSTDTSRDHDYTDWSRVDALADRIAELAGPEAQVPA
jgi:menaquinone-dependent protoporphyrinogen oxidase